MSAPQTRARGGDRDRIPPLNEEFMRALDEVKKTVERMERELEEMKKEFERAMEALRRGIEISGSQQGG